MTSRKLMICLLASMVMRSPLLLKMRHISFLVFSVSLGEPVNYRCSVFPLVEVACFCDVAVNTVEDAFADFAYLGFRRVD